MKSTKPLCWLAIWLAILLLLPGTSVAQNPVGADPSQITPVGPDQAGAADPDGTSVVFVDGDVTPGTEGTAVSVVPFALPTSADSAGGATSVDVQLPPLPEDQFPPQYDTVAGPPLQIGVVRALPQPVATGSRELGAGHWQALSSGAQYWTLTLGVVGAKGQRLHLEDIAFPPGGYVLVYNTDNPAEISGPYGARELHGAADLWTATIFGPRVTIEYYVPPGSDAGSAGFTVTEVAHIYVDLTSALLGPQVLGCQNDVSCSPAWSNEALGVAGLGTINGGVALWCSGALLNDFDGATYVGYFLTANHCLSGNKADLGTQAQANSTEYYWRYQTPSCNGAVPNLATVPRTATGADLLSVRTANGGNDHAFMRIRGDLPGGLALLGWTTASFADGNAAIGVHHPDGSWKRISFGGISDSNSNYWTVDWTDGVTEPGSSGSPIFDSEHRVRGQACCMNVVGECPDDNTTVVTDYGRYDVTYLLIRRWMEIGGTINANSSYSGIEEGTPTRPFRTASAANNFAWNGSRIRFQAGNYPGPITFSKQVTLIAQDGIATIGQ